MSRPISGTTATVGVTITATVTPQPSATGATVARQAVSPTQVPGLTPTLPPSLAHTPTQTPTQTPTPSRTATPSSTPDPRRRVVAFVSDVTGNDDVYLLDVETGGVINLTYTPGEDRDPAFSADGRSLIFRSNLDGFWVFYHIDLVTGERTPLAADGAARMAYNGSIAWSPLGGYRYVYESYRNANLDLYVQTQDGRSRPLTRHPAGDYGPAWRPNAAQIAFTSWRQGNKDLYVIDADGRNLVRLTTEATDEEEPTWHPSGQRLVFVRWEDRDADLYELDLSSGAITPLTTDPYPDRSPTYAPDGTLFWVRYVPGRPFEVHDPYYPGQWRLWMRDSDGRERPVSLPVADMDVYTPAAGLALWPDNMFPSLDVPTPTLTTVPVGLNDLIRLDVQSAGGDPRIHAHLVGAYHGWRMEVLAQSGYDLLGSVSDMFRPLGYSSRVYGHLSWHRTGRAVDMLFEWRDPKDDRNRLLVAREDLGSQTYWRLYLQCREQDGAMGEPLTAAPWVFWFALDATQEPEAYANGGRPGVIPSGYYVDLTRLAKRHGWHRIASYEEPDFDWRTDSVGREFWHYERADGLTWWQAMSQIYPAEILETYYGWTVCVSKLGMDPSWVRAKGIPTPTPTP